MYFPSIKKIGYTSHWEINQELPKSLGKMLGQEGRNKKISRGEIFYLNDVEIQIEKIGTCFFDRLFLRYPKIKTNLITLFAETSEKAKPYEEKIQSFLNKENLEYAVNRFKPLS